MRFYELSIQTQRSAPAEIRTAGASFLFRAGYISRQGELQVPGKRAIEKISRQIETWAGVSVPEILSRLELPYACRPDESRAFALFQAAPEEILLCPSCGYADFCELAGSRREVFSREEPLPLEKVQTPECGTIAQLAEFMKMPQQKTAKALMYTRLSDGKLIFVIVRGDLQMSEAKLKALLGDFRLASADEIKACGAVPGYASPIGIHDALVVVDELVEVSPNLVAGANEHGFHLKNTNYPRDYTADLVADLTLAETGNACPTCGKEMESRPALTVFAEGKFLWTNLLQALAESHHDERGLTLPFAVAAFDVYLMNLPGKTIDTEAVARELVDPLEAAGLSVLYDDRDERAGVKFNDADLIGCPLRVTVGERGLLNGMLEVKPRWGSETRLIPPEHLVEELRSLKSERSKVY